MKKRPRYDMEASGENMRQIRIERGLSVEEVRRYMEFESVQSVYKWEKGRCFPTADNLLALAELYGVDPEELLIKAEQKDPDTKDDGKMFDYILNFIRHSSTVRWQRPVSPYIRRRNCHSFTRSFETVSKVCLGCC